MKNPVRVMVAGSPSKLHEMFAILKSISWVKICCIVTSGTEAINRYAEAKPDIIFSDVVLRGMSGLETARFIKEQSPLMKIVICSSKFETQFLLAVLSMRFDGYLPGYGNKTVIAETIKGVLKNKTQFPYGGTNIHLKQLMIYQCQQLFSEYKNRLSLEDNEYPSLI
jgi:DNA-binding NarL/FixJ family response regulator